MQENRTNKAAPWAVLALALGIRLVGIARFALHPDEVGRLVWLSQPHFDAAESAVMGKGALASLWLSKLLYDWPGTLFWVRLPYALAGVAGVAAIFALTRRISGERAALAAALLTALAPMHVAYSQLFEEYVFVFLFAALALIFALDFLKSPENVGAFAAKAFALTSLGLLLGGYLILPYFTALAAMLAWELRERLSPRDWLLLAASQLPVLALFVWLWTGAGEAAAYYHEITRLWGFLPLAFKPQAVLVDLLSHVELWLWMGTPLWLSAIEWILAAAMIALLVQGARSVREEAGEPAARVLVGSLLGCAAILACAFAFLYDAPQFRARAYMAVLPGVLALIVLGWRRSGARLRLFAGVSLGIPGALSLAMIAWGLHPSYPPYMPLLANTVAQQQRQGTPLSIHPPYLAEMLPVAARLMEMQALVDVGEACPMARLFPVRADEARRREVLAACANDLAAAKRCMLGIPVLYEAGLDPEHTLSGALSMLHGYAPRPREENSPTGAFVEVLCPAGPEG